jgi:predicted amidohydrolase YtcJ
MKPRLITTIAFFCLTLGSYTPNATTIETADLALINGRVWLGGDSPSFAEAIAVQGNRILRVGKTSEIKPLIDERTRVMDLGKRLAAPGFNDAHIHFLSGSLGLTEVDLTNSRTVAEMIERIAVYARNNPQAQWIKGRGWEYAKFPGGLPTRSYLDAIIKNRPVFLSAYDGHSAWVNSKALQIAGITKGAKFEGFGEIVLDTYGEPSGVLKEGAQLLVRKFIPESSREQKMDALRRGMKMAASLGITSIQNASGSPEDFSLYEDLLKRGELTLRVSMAFSAGGKTTQREIGHLTAIKSRYELNPMLRASAVKFMLDGVIESHTAAMIERYSDLPANHSLPYGELAIPPDAYRDLVTQLDKAGFQIYTHAIGDRAVREALHAYEIALKTNHRGFSRHRIEHLEMVSADDIPRFAKLNVVASMEPIHADPGTVEVWSRAVGLERLPFAFSWSSLLKSRAILVFGSDWPASISVDPIRGIHSAVNRRTLDGQPPRAWIPEQRISISDALRAYTHAGAFSSFEESIKGSIAPGMLADIIVFSQDLFKIDSMRIGETKVVMTVFDGKVIYLDDLHFN